MKGLILILITVLVAVFGNSIVGFVWGAALFIGLIFYMIPE